jgi:hypothetical protein
MLGQPAAWNAHASPTSPSSPLAWPRAVSQADSTASRAESGSSTISRPSSRPSSLLCSGSGASSSQERSPFWGSSTPCVAKWSSA